MERPVPHSTIPISSAWVKNLPSSAAEPTPESSGELWYNAAAAKPLRISRTSVLATRPRASLRSKPHSIRDTKAAATDGWRCASNRWCTTQLRKWKSSQFLGSNGANPGAAPWLSGYFVRGWWHPRSLERGPCPPRHAASPVPRAALQREPDDSVSSVAAAWAVRAHDDAFSRSLRETRSLRGSLADFRARR